MSIPRVQALLKDLEKIKADCLGEEKADTKSRPKDDFYGIKEQITTTIDKIAKVPSPLPSTCCMLSLPSTRMVGYPSIE
jgi:hypothetical protein